RDRILGVAEHLLLQIGHTEPDLLALARIRRELDLLAIHVEQLGPALIARVETLERLERPLVVGIDRLRATEIFNRLLGLLELAVVCISDGDEQLAKKRLRFFAFAEPLDRILVQRDELAPVVGDGREPLELRPRGRVARLLAEAAG